MAPFEHLWDSLDDIRAAVTAMGADMRVSKALRSVPDTLTAMQHVATVIFACAGVAWVVAFVSGLRMIKHRATGVTIGYLATHGIAFFQDKHFTAAAAPHRRRLYVAFAVFVALAIAGAMLGAVAASSPKDG